MLYWSDWGSDKIQRANLDGSNVEDLVAGAGLDGPDGLTLDLAGGKIYWTDAGTEKIQRADLDGSNVEDLVTTGLGVPYGLDLDVSGGKIYWTNRSTSKIQRADLDGSNVEDLLTLSGLAFPGELAVDAAGGKIYWTNAGADKIQRADLDGSNVEDLVTTGLSSPNGLALDVDGGKIYWTDRGTSRIQRADLDGSNVEDLVTTGLSSPNGLALDVDGGKIYWTDVDADNIQRADLDGANVEDLLTSVDGLVDPSGIALGALSDDGEPVPPSSLCASGGAVPDAANNPGLVADCEALLEARDPLAGTAALNWSASTPISSWTGVTLGGTPQRVTKLRLWNLSLNGTVPSELSRLNHLEALYLAYNQLTGTIPAELGNLTGLTHLGLIHNQLTGAIPPELARLTNLRQLGLQDNQLTGSIPAWVGGLSRLQILNLHNNQLTGTIPAELGNLTDLWQLLLFGNQLTGPIPAELGSLTKLREVRLDQNQLTGAIPAELADLARLTLLRLSGNQLTGCIPASLRDIGNNDMDELGLSDCAATQAQVKGDFNGDGNVDFADFFELVDAFGSTDSHFDLDGSGTVDFGDFFAFVDAFVNASGQQEEARQAGGHGAGNDRAARGAPVAAERAQSLQQRDCHLLVPEPTRPGASRGILPDRTAGGGPAQGSPEGRAPPHPMGRPRRRRASVGQRRLFLPAGDSRERTDPQTHPAQVKEPGSTAGSFPSVSMNRPLQSKTDEQRSLMKSQVFQPQTHRADPRGDGDIYT